MLPPPAATYESAIELFQSAQTFANSQGYVLVKKRTRKDHHGNLKNMILRCDRGGVYNSSKIHQRQTSTRLIDCPFELYAARCDNLWYIRVRDSSHNHDPSEDLSGHPMSRRLTKQQLVNVEEMTASGSRPREIISTIRQNDPLALVICKDIYNARERLRQKNLVGRTPVEALIDELKEGDYIYEYKCDDTGHITHLFFTHNESVMLTCRYLFIFLMDCTYKTNKYRMPLLNVVGITSFNTTFFSCFIFMKDEDEEDYLWALTCITKLFNGISNPHVIVTDRELALMNALKTAFLDSTNLLCLWHINKNIMKNCKSQFEEGTTVTSRVEGAHATIKTYLHTSAGDLRNVRIKLSLAVNNQKQELDTKISSEKIRFPTFVQNNSLYANIKNKISNFALKKVDEQYQRIKCATTQDPLPPCTGSFSSTMGLPCAHKIQIIENNQGLTLDDFHEHWWIQEHSSIPSIETNIQELQPLLQTLQEKYEEWPEHQQSAAREKLNNLINTPLTVLQNPQIVRTRGRPAGASNRRKNNSTRRDPSGFELVECKIR
ncbi:9522_t:CDS:2 [Cetraspora pellucida]|uniref:9522_t:CDS:1 n=1 Tax=Cetraspora pellucida TaxID=1433469 RepID=A0A9N8VRR1_9GLOM|nr:9522_t:CDS:2 [Cetraspora pellucida]